MSFLLDTNVISEMVKAVPEPRVARWMAGQDPANLYLSAITIGELTRGVAKLPDGSRRQRLGDWIDALKQEFDGRVLPFDREAASIWGAIMGEADRKGRPRAALDGQIAATAKLHAVALVTRDAADFQGMGVTIVDPWQA